MKFYLEDAKKIAEVIGTTPEQFIQDAIDRAVAPYRDEDGNVHFQPAIYEGMTCYVAGEQSIFGEPYKKIVVKGELIAVPAKLVNEK